MPINWRKSWRSRELFFRRKRRRHAAAIQSAVLVYCDYIRREITASQFVRTAVCKRGLYICVYSDGPSKSRWFLCWKMARQNRHRYLALAVCMPYPKLCPRIRTRVVCICWRWRTSAGYVFIDAFKIREALFQNCNKLHEVCFWLCIRRKLCNGEQRTLNF